MYVLLALALLLAPLGVCLGGGAAMAVASHQSAMHHASPASGSHGGHGGPGRIHYCPECQPPSFVKAWKVAVSDIAPSSAAIVPVAPAAAFAFNPARSAWAPSPASRPPPPRRTYRIRLRI